MDSENQEDAEDEEVEDEDVDAIDLSEGEDELSDEEIDDEEGDIEGESEEVCIILSSNFLFVLGRGSNSGGGYVWQKC